MTKKRDLRPAISSALARMKTNKEGLARAPWTQGRYMTLAPVEQIIEYRDCYYVSGPPNGTTVLAVIRGRFVVGCFVDKDGTHLLSAEDINGRKFDAYVHDLRAVVVHMEDARS